MQEHGKYCSLGTGWHLTLKEGSRRPRSDLCKTLEILPSAKCSFGILSTACYPDSSMTWGNMSMKPLQSLWAWKWEKRKHKWQSSASKMSMPPYASAKTCVIHSVPKSDKSDMQVAMIQPGCLVTEFASLPRTLPSYWNKHPFFFTAPSSSPFSPQFQIFLQHKENRVKMNGHSYHKKYLSSCTHLSSNFFVKSCVKCTALYM